MKVLESMQNFLPDPDFSSAYVSRIEKALQAIQTLLVTPWTQEQLALGIPLVNELVDLHNLLKTLESNVSTFRHAPAAGFSGDGGSCAVGRMEVDADSAAGGPGAGRASPYLAMKYCCSAIANVLRAVATDVSAIA